jgi:hypothetical protein
MLNEGISEREAVILIMRDFEYQGGRPMDLASAWRRNRLKWWEGISLPEEELPAALAEAHAIVAAYNEEEHGA